MPIAVPCVQTVDAVEVVGVVGSGNGRSGTGAGAGAGEKKYIYGV